GEKYSNLAQYQIGKSLALYKLAIYMIRFAPKIAKCLMSYSIES
ncbi:hypothetical protein HMPREF1574_01283, partial [Gardnerella pickettii JCP7659]